jgi:hypothetical protein
MYCTTEPLNSGILCDVGEVLGINLFLRAVAGAFLHKKNALAKLNIPTFQTGTYF